MTSIGFDLTHVDEIWRGKLYRGDLYVSSPTTPMLGLIGHARSLIEEAYDADPTRAQYGMTPEQFSAVGGPLKLPTELLAEDDSGDTEGGALVFTPALHEQATTPASLQ